MDKTSLGNRMKQYEAVPKNFLTRRTPVIIRLDGKAFHSVTKGFDKPFDSTIERAMKETMLYLCRNIQGCVLGYTQSDEITLVLCDYQNIDTDAWFSYNVQKMVSVAAAMATFAFSTNLDKIACELERLDQFDVKIDLINKKLCNGIFFDARAFNLPKEEVVNCLIWRQQDATRNSIQGLAQSLFSHKELQGLNCSKLQDKIFNERGINWNDLSVYQKRGVCAIKGLKFVNSVGVKDNWIIDDNTPIFTQERDYITSRINFE